MSHWWVPAAIFILLAGCSGKEARVNEHLRKAREFYARYELNKAQLEARNAIQVDARRAEGHLIVARIDEIKEDWQRALGGYHRVIGLDPANVEAKVRAARIYLAARDAPSADKLVGELLAADPSNDDAQALRARLLAQSGDIDAAIQVAGGVAARTPGHADAIGVLADALVRRGAPAAALALVQGSVDANPKSHDLRVALGALLAQVGDRERQEENLLRMIDLNPRRFENRAALALFHAQGGDFSRAERVLREAIDADPLDDKRHLALADLLIEQGGIDAGERELLQAIARRPRAGALKLKLAQLYSQSAQPARANRIYTEVIAEEKTGPIAVQARLQLAANESIAGRDAEAASLVAQVLRDSSREPRALVLRARLALTREDAAAAIADLRAVTREPFAPIEAIALLARAHRMNRDPEAGLDAIMQAIKLAPDRLELHMLAIDHLIATGRADAALRELEALIREHPRYATAYEAKAALHAADRDTGALERTFAALKLAAPANPAGPYRLGLAYAARQHYDAAVRELEEALARAPDASEILAALVATHAASGRVEQALERARELTRQAPASVVAHLQVGELELARRRLREAEAAFARARELGPTVAGGYLGLARVLVAEREFDKADTVLETGLTRAPEDVRLALARVDVRRARGEHEAALAQLEGLFRRFPMNELVANNLAVALGEAGRELDRGLFIARRFEASDNPAYVHTLGWLHVKRGAHSMAVTFLQRAHQRSPQAALYQYHLGAALVASGKRSEGIAFLERAVASDPNAEWIDEARRLLAS